MAHRHLGSIVLVGMLVACSGRTEGSARSGTVGPGGGAGSEGDGGPAGGAGGSKGGAGGAGGVAIDSGIPPAPPAPTLAIMDVAYGGGRFVAVGVDEADVGRIYASSDGDSWKLAAEDPATHFWQVEYGNGRFVVIGLSSDYSCSYAVTSPSGDAFSPRVQIPGARLIQHMAFGTAFGGLFMAVDNARLWTTVDGTAWLGQQIDLGSNSDIGDRGVAFGAGRFFVWAEMDENVYASNEADAGAGAGIGWHGYDVSGADHQYPVDVRVLNGSVVTTTQYDCCYGEVPYSSLFGRAVTTDGTSWSFTSDGNEPHRLPVFADDSSCVASVPTTFAAADGSPIDCSLLPGSDASGGYTGSGRVAAPPPGAQGNGTYVVAFKNGILTSHDGTTWTRTLTR